MSHNISGTDSYPLSFAIPDDGEQRDAASVDTGLSALANRTTFLRNRFGAGGFDAVFTANGTWTCPAGVTMVQLQGCGAGGGGGAGVPGAILTSDHPIPGAGGGGALLGHALFPVTPGTTYNVVVGAGGPGGVYSGGGGQPGGDGGDTSFSDGVNATVFRGAAGGKGGLTTTVQTAVAVGGPPVGPLASVVYDVAISQLANAAISKQPAQGGYGVGTVEANNFDMGTGGRAPTLLTTSSGGSKGLGGANDTGFIGGGGGGGGGQGPAGGGGNGGGGGAANASGAGTAATAGTSAAANTGAGGGGGGAGGSGSASGGAGASGGDGGSGFLRVICIRVG